ncbi:MAG: hypothetical protein HYT63_00050 [Candidatus Yanofskybacteria bacterium]|nr:hypothetical protein [Candidatus Yanofskybacteria bacterium]
MDWLIAKYHPCFLTAGDYLLKVQNRVQSVSKDGDSPFTTALTDADLSVQNLFEITTLANHPELAFDSEEESMSLNKKYFPREAEYRILLDPIDGTKNFKDGGKTFGVVMTVVKDRQIYAVAMYLPAYRKFFYSVRCGGTYLAATRRLSEKGKIQTLALPRAGVVRTDHASKDLIERIDKVIQVKEITRDYDPQTWRWPKFGILTGEIDGFVKMDAPLEDWGAIAFMAENAGAMVSDKDGNLIPNYFDFPDRKIPSLVVSRDYIAHSLVLNALKSWE